MGQVEVRVCDRGGRHTQGCLVKSDLVRERKYQERVERSLPCGGRKQEQRFCLGLYTWNVELQYQRGSRRKGEALPPPLGEKLLEPWVAGGIITKGRHKSVHRSKMDHLRHGQLLPWITA